MNKTYIVCGVLAVLIIVAIAFFGFSRVQPAALSDLREIQLDGQSIHVSIADTEASRQLGLGGRDGLAPNEGMLFIFPADGIFSFWMKDMKFAIDIIWLDENMKVTYIKKNAEPSSYPETYYSGDEAKYVLEVNAGFSDINNLKAGDGVEFVY